MGNEGRIYKLIGSLDECVCFEGMVQGSGKEQDSVCGKTMRFLPGALFIRREN